jgi:hypothetical protein
MYYVCIEGEERRGEEMTSYPGMDDLGCAGGTGARLKFLNKFN